MISMKNFILGLGVIALYILHQDIWFWDVAQPLVFGLVSIAWPVELEREVERESSDSSEDVS